ncbi:helix-turn-helix transcriptional regulator [Nocardia sp. NPDC101769]|uniref:helix-turn-helix transcriptional regulator n=1 Tax=Nocardia sp. NPDC101769 TaxID=3364333 RepID=UPI0037F34160
MDLSQEATLEAIGTSALASALWSTVDGTVTATVFPESADITSDVVRFARQLTCTFPSARVRRVHRDLVTASDIAHRTGFSREAVRKWANESNDRSFPVPFGAIGEESRTSKIWLWSDIAEWLIAAYDFPIERDWPSESVIAHIDARLANVPDYAAQEWRIIQTGSMIGTKVLGRIELMNFSLRTAELRIRTCNLEPEGTIREHDEAARA